jgi:hypothetical protein
MLFANADVMRIASLPLPMILAKWAKSEGVTLSEETLASEPILMTLARIASAVGVEGSIPSLAMGNSEVTLLARIGAALGAGTFSDLIEYGRVAILARIFEHYVSENGGTATEADGRNFGVFTLLAMIVRESEDANFDFWLFNEGDGDFFVSTSDGDRIIIEEL